MKESIGRFRFLSRTGQLYPSRRGELVDGKEQRILYFLCKSDHPMSSHFCDLIIEAKV